MEKAKILEILEHFRMNLSKSFGIISMGLFGSFARGENHSDSDVDIFVEMETPNPFFLVEIKEELEVLLNRKVDIVRMRSSMNPFLKARIEKEGIYV
jgi:uncharacterized protein